MAGAMRKLGLYLGLVEDDEDARSGAYDEDHYGYDDEPAPTRAYRAEAPAPRRHLAQTVGATAGPITRGSMALDTSPRAHVAAAPAHEDGYRITTLTPTTYNEARTIGEHFREGIPVIINLTEMDDSDAKRLVDFAAGLIFGLHGSIERVTTKVFLLSPEHVEVTADDKARIVEGGFFNQS